MDEYAGRLPGQALSPKFCIVGGDGLIGRALTAACHTAGIPAISTSRKSRSASHVRLDLADPGSIHGFSLQPEVAYLCAAATNMRICEERPVETWKINVEGVAAIAQRLRATGAHLIFLSTNAVFDGTKRLPTATDAVMPANEYGRQKAEAEAQVARLGGCTIVRMTKVLSAELPLIREWRSRLLRGESISPFTDLCMAPIAISFVVEALLKLGLSGRAGVIHLSGEQDLSYAEFARLYADSLGANRELVKPTTSEIAGVPLARSPSSTALAMSRAEAELGLQPQTAFQVAEQLVRCAPGS